MSPRIAICTIACALLAAAFAVPQDPAAASGPRVVVVPIRGGIDIVTARLVQRAVGRARAIGASRVVLDIDTPGGRVDAMQEIQVAVDGLRGGGVRTTAWVAQDALSAGAYLALCCDEVFMASGARLGAITPVVEGPGGIMQIPEDDARAKMLSAMRADVRGLIERRGNASPELLALAEAMVDPRLGRIYEVQVEGRDGLQRNLVVDETAMESLTRDGSRVLTQAQLGTAPLTLTGSEALRFGFSSGTFTTLDDLVRQELGVPPSAIERLERNWSEEAVAWLEAIKPLLFVVGFLLLLAELKMPGFGVPGVLGILFVALALFSSWLVGLADWTEILLFFLGLGLLGVEAFVMPGTVIFGLLGFVSLVLALILSQQTFVFPANATQEEILTGNLLDLLWLILLVTAGAAAMWRVLPKLPYFNRALLEPPDRAGTGASTRFAGVDASRAQLVGVVGIAATDLRPAGVLALDDGARLDVVSQGEFVRKGARLKVLEVGGNRIVVEPVGEDGHPEAEHLDGERGETAIGLLFLLLAFGFALVVAEVFFVSFGVLAVGAGVALVTAIFLAFAQHGPFFGFLFLALAIAGAPIAFAVAWRALPNTRFGKKLILDAPDPALVRGAAAEQGLAALLDRLGVTSSALRPSGFAEIDGRRIDVVTRGEPIAQGRTVRVLAIDGNRVVVTEVANAPGADTHPDS
ncbi:MAG: hypothetical protein HZB39_07165 [Planctomycetes bacterium]|nr:hypothetical protein [Planctomycetota bacterium]